MECVTYWTYQRNVRWVGWYARWRHIRRIDFPEIWGGRGGVWSNILWVLWNDCWLGCRNICWAEIRWNCVLSTLLAPIFLVAKRCSTLVLRLFLGRGA